VGRGWRAESARAEVRAAGEYERGNSALREDDSPASERRCATWAVRARGKAGDEGDWAGLLPNPKMVSVLSRSMRHV